MGSLMRAVVVTAMVGTASAATITFRVEPAWVPDQGKVFIVGNHPALGNWRPGAVPLSLQPDGAWARTFSFPVGAALEYKVTLGSWDREALREDGSVPPNAHLTVTGDTILVIPVQTWKARPHAPAGGITGTVHSHEAMGADGVLPRTVHVWLPPGYESSTERYPVLYMHDGQQVFDPATSSFGIDWQVDETATRLIEMGQLRPLIVVAVNNTEDRYEEYADTDRGAAYRRFLIQTVKPFIDATYRTVPDRDHTAVMGSSMGGLASFLLTWYHPDVFSAAACLSPALFMHDLKKASSMPPPSLPVRLYLDNGGVGLERRLQAGCDRMLEILRRKGMKLGDDLVWFHEPEAGHNEAAWAARVWRPLRFIFGIGDQEWCRGLAPPPEPVYEARDHEPAVLQECPGTCVVGFMRSVRLHHWGERFPAIFDSVSHLLPPPDASRDRVLALWGPYEDALLDVLIGQDSDSTETVPEGMTRVPIAPARCRILTHYGACATLAETLDYLYTWWLTGSSVDLTGPVLVRWSGMSFEMATVCVPITAENADEAPLLR